jgi:hypothetical protein
VIDLGFAQPNVVSHDVHYTTTHMPPSYLDLEASVSKQGLPLRHKGGVIVLASPHLRTRKHVAALTHRLLMFLPRRIRSCFSRVTSPSVGRWTKLSPSQIVGCSLCLNPLRSDHMRMA